MVAEGSSCYLRKGTVEVCPHFIPHWPLRPRIPDEDGMRPGTDGTVILPVVEFGDTHEGERGGTRATHMTEYHVIALSRAKF